MQIASMHFKQRAHENMGNAQLQGNLQKIKGKFVAKRGPGIHHICFAVDDLDAAASGLASATLVRTSASYSTPDVCGAFASPTTIVGNPAQNGLATG